jgi:hypothetical protein
MPAPPAGSSDLDVFGEAPVDGFEGFDGFPAKGFHDRGEFREIDSSDASFDGRDEGLWFLEAAGEFGLREAGDFPLLDEAEPQGFMRRTEE